MLLLHTTSIILAKKSMEECIFIQATCSSTTKEDVVLPDGEDGMFLRGEKK
jgi:hypothetical protein